ncbi:MAG: monovalent cation/H(+) antiporter subunit G [Oscillospiraceae bacterium]|nr:monovalent cation/H(+) antiporter subunit G [Oscillospiraceae bacterium]
MELVGNIVIGIGVFLMLFGVIGLFRFPNFYYRLLVAPKIDTVGALTVIIGIVLRHGLSFFSLRAVLLLGFMLIVNPMVTYVLAHSAYVAGYTIDPPEDMKKQE